MNKEDNETLKYFKKVYDELMQDEKYQKYSSLLKYYHKRILDLKQQLEEKDKIINEAIEFIDDYKSYEEVNKQVKTHQFVRAYEDILDEENIAKLLEILERGKNGK